MSPTTPPRPFDVTALFPQLAPLARTATRLHPRPGSPTPHDSRRAAPLAADEPWPHCEGPHEWDRVNEILSPAAAHPGSSGEPAVRRSPTVPVHA
ncbi:hypothetical protein GCM10010317_096820 [Streptomyces mirabilis]|nr:hypothetical protein [Streptomyces mirabilis]GHD78069.1 hypothetical protein GCM10010317_096820 [Streptomyces mirabilis]